MSEIDWGTLPPRQWKAYTFYTEFKPDIADAHGVVFLQMDDVKRRNRLEDEDPAGIEALTHLWAAAPDLYDALRALVEVEARDIDLCDDKDCALCQKFGPVLEQARAALAKAEGVTYAE